MPDEDLSEPYLEAMRRGFDFARELGSGCRPVHFLVGISEGDGSAAAALDTGPSPSLRAVVSHAGGATDSAAFLHMQAQEAARSLAATRGQTPEAEHLLVALIDQGDPEVLAALSTAGLELAEVRRAALTAIGGSGDEPTLEPPSLTPAGTLDRPPLPIADLEERAWTVLRWRQDHLPLHRVRRPSDAQALSHLERDAAWRLADRLQVSEDQRYSLIDHHAEEVERRADIAKPGSRRQPGTPPVAVLLARRHRRPRHPAVLNVTVGWAAWFSNRRVGARNRWFRLRTFGDYRGCPQP